MTEAQARLVEDAYALRIAHKMLREIDPSALCENKQEAVAFLGLVHQVRAWRRKLDEKVGRLLL